MRRRSNHDSADRAVESITQARFMVRIYSEILAMDETIMERIEQLMLGQQSGTGDSAATLGNMTLILAQLEKVGERIAFWNSRVRELVEGQLHR